MEKIKNKKVASVLFWLIFILAAVVRFYGLASNPPSLNWDEVSHGYNAYSLLKTGKDQWGIPWPVFNFRAYGDYPMALNLYLTIPVVKILGLNAFSIRFPSALLGLLTVVSSYFLAKVLFGKKSHGLLLMFLTALSPWMVLPSRAVFQSTIASAFLVFGVTLFFYALKNLKAWWLLFSCLFWALSGYGYHNTRLIVLPLFLAALFFYRKEIFKLFAKSKLLTMVSLLLFATISLAQLWNLVTPESRARAKWVSLIDQGVINQINEARGVSGSSFWARVLHNKVTYLIPLLGENFLSYFNSKYLFFTGGDHYQFSVPDKGVLSPAGLPFFYLGLIILILNLFKKKKEYFFLTAWLVIGLIPAIITRGQFQVVRSMSVLPLPQILVVLGFFKVLDFLRRKSKIKGRSLTGVFLVSVLISFLSWWSLFWNSYRSHYSWSWQYGYKEAVEYVRENYSQYDKIVFTKKCGEPHEFVLFWWPWQPEFYQQDSSKVWDYHADWYWVDAFDKFEFWNDWQVKEKLVKKQSEKILLITSPGNWVEPGELLKTINLLDGETVFEIVEYDG